MHPPVTIAPNYTRKVFDPKAFPILTKRMIKAAKAIMATTPFNMLAGCGNSGLPLLGAMGLRLKMPILACRKSGDSAHDDAKVNGHIVEGKYLIIDDLISTGSTVKWIRGNILNEVAKKHITNQGGYPWGVYKPDLPVETWLPQCAGILTYEGVYKLPVETWLPQCAGILTYEAATSRPFNFRHQMTEVNYPLGALPEVAEQVPVYFVGDF